MYIDRKKRTVEYFDSFGKPPENGVVEQKLSDIAKKLSYQYVCKVAKKLQKDTYQCGVWALYFLESRLMDPEFDFDSKIEISEASALIERYRKKVQEILIDQSQLQVSPLLIKGNAIDY